MSDHWSGLMLMLSLSNVLANRRRISSKTHLFGTSGLMLSGPEVCPSRRLYFQFVECKVVVVYMHIISYFC